MTGEILMVVGAAFVLLSAVGVLRFGDPLARMHALSKASTFGILLILLGTLVDLHDLNDVTSVVLAGLLHLLTSPPASNMVSRAAYRARRIPSGDNVVDEGAEPLGLAPAEPED